ncbi:MAG: GYF domain-containing protein [Pirellulaceae bacterium]
MSLELSCPHCQRLFHPTAELAGKLAACPHCGKQVRIPAVESRLQTVESGIDPRWKTRSTTWHVQAEDGKQYGPVTGEQLQAWYEEGRITANCQLLRKGTGQWQWATDLYPDLEQNVGAKHAGPAESKPAKPRPAVRAAPAQSGSPITPLSPSDFPTVGSGLKALGPAIRPLPPGHEEPLFHSAEAMEDRRRFAPFMVAHMNRKPLHKMLLVVAVTNFLFGTVRAGLYFVLFISCLMAIGALGEQADQQLVTRGAISLIVALVMMVLNIFIISGGFGLLQQKEWGRTATFVGTLIGMIIQLTCLCVTGILGADGSGLARVTWVIGLVILGPSVLYDAFAAITLTMPSIVADLED